MKKTVGIMLILALPLLILFSALGNASKGANYPKHVLEKAVTHDKKEPHPKKIKPSIIK